MKATPRILVCIAAALAGCIVCGACNHDGDMSTNGTMTQNTNPATMVQQGQNGVKARAGGGMMGNPEPAKPGEKTGLPK